MRQQREEALLLPRARRPCLEDVQPLLEPHVKPRGRSALLVLVAVWK